MSTFSTGQPAKRKAEEVKKMEEEDVQTKKCDKRGDDRGAANRKSATSCMFGHLPTSSLEGGKEEDGSGTNCWRKIKSVGTKNTFIGSVRKW